MIAIIDYGVGNLFSLKSSLAAIGREAVGAVTMGLDAHREAAVQAMIRAGAPGWVREILLLCINK